MAPPTHCLRPSKVPNCKLSFFNTFFLAIFFCCVQEVITGFIWHHLILYSFEMGNLPYLVFFCSIFRLLFLLAFLEISRFQTELIWHQLIPLLTSIHFPPCRKAQIPIIFSNSPMPSHYTKLILTSLETIFASMF